MTTIYDQLEISTASAVADAYEASIAVMQTDVDDAKANGREIELDDVRDTIRGQAINEITHGFAYSRIREVLKIAQDALNAMGVQDGDDLLADALKDAAREIL